ncbi:hypothetical protein E4U53_004727 [Claviceps sorghi]|nr:hypothetical protein E4U53_004727 [Claviceps sorghi]
MEASDPSLINQVHAGKDAPITQESAGLVLNDSLAAESYQAGGKFTQNRDATPEDASFDLASKASSRGSDAGGKGKGAQGDAAPTYINSQYIKDTHGPHGKNLKEEDFDYQQVFDSQRRVFKAAPGSIDDPGRVAEVKFEKEVATTPLAATVKDSNKMSEGTAYDSLERDISA